MVLGREITTQIKEVLARNPQGLSITDIVREVPVNRNTAGRYLEKLLISGQVEMRHFGMAKIYALANRVPVSAVLSISSELIMQLDNSTRIVFINDAFARFLGTPVHDLVGKNIEYSPLAMAFDDLFSGFLDRVRAGLTGTEWNGELAPAEGKIVFSCRIAPAALDHGQKGVTVILEEITAQKRAYELLHESEERYRRLLQRSFDAVVVHRNGIITQANRAAVNLVGAPTLSELIGKNILDLVHPDFRDFVRERMAALTSGNEMNTVDAAEEKFMRIDGKAIDVEVVATGFLDAGKPAVQVVFRDITRRKELVEALHQSEEKYRILVEHSQSGVFIIQGHQIRYVNSAFARILGCVPGDFIAHDFAEFIAPEDRDRVLERGLSRQRGETVPENYECRLLKCDGTTRVFVSLDAGLIRYHGEPASMGTIRDITEQKRAEAALIEGGEKLRAIFDSTFQFTGMMAPEGTLIDVNRTALEFAGVRREDVISRPFWETAWWQGDEARVQRLREAIGRAASGTFVRYEVELQGAGITSLMVDFSIKPVFDSAGNVLMLIPEGRDITKSKQTEEALRESEDRFRRIFEDGPLGMAIVGRDYRFVLVNRMLCEMMGYTDQELLARSFADITHPGHLDQDVAEVEKLYAGKIARYRTEKRYIRMDGSVIWGALTVSPLRDREGCIVSTLSLVEDITKWKQTGK